MKKLSSRLLRFLCAVILYSCATGAVTAQSSNWLWAQAPEETFNAFIEGGAVATDNNGHVIMTGSFTGDSIAFSGVTLYNTQNNGGGEIVFTVKYDASGNVLWARSGTGNATAGASGVATDASGNIYITGYFSSYLDDDSINFGPYTLYSNSTEESDIFVVKYDSSGNVIWAKSGGEANIYSIATDAHGQVFITGSFYEQSMTFGGITMTGTFPYAYIFIMELDTAGNALWGKNEKEHYYPAYIYSVATDRNGNAYITGFFSDDTITFGTFNLYNATPGDSTPNVFIVKYDTSGTVLWARSAGGNGADYGMGITTDKNNGIYATGAFSSDSIAFGQHTLYNATPGLNPDCFIVKYDAMGNAVWAKSAGGNQIIMGNSIAADTSGNVFVAGQFNADTMTFENIILQVATNIDYPMFMLCLDSNGNVHSAGALTNGGGSWPNSAAVDYSGNAYVSGYANDQQQHHIDTMTVANDTIVIDSLTGGIFIAKYSCTHTELAVSELSEDVSLQIFPNPFSAQAVVQYSLPSGSQNAQLVVYDMLGQQRGAYRLSNTYGEISISAGNLTTGVYLYSLLVDGKSTLTKKMVVGDRAF